MSIRFGHVPKSPTKITYSAELSKVCTKKNNGDSFTLPLMCAPSIGKKQRNQGGVMSFDTRESSNLIHSVPLPRVDITGAVGLVTSYFIDYQLFR